MKQNIKAIILGLIITVGMSYAFGSEYKYPCAGAPTCNTSLPVNTSSSMQVKSGPLSVGTSVLPPSGYIFSVPSGTSLIDGLVTVGLTITGGAGNGKILKYNAGSGTASWQNLSAGSNISEMKIQEFTINVPRNSNLTNGVTKVIPATYQYCAITQLGPDFSNSNNGDEKIASVCSVNRNTADGTWKLYGNRMDDPDMICKAQCFTITSKTAEYDMTTFVPSPGVLSKKEEQYLDSLIGSGRKIYIK